MYKNKAARAGMQSGAADAVCYICMEGIISAVDTGCDCKGGTAVVHTECLVSLAVHQWENKHDDLWYRCNVCRGRFSGRARIRLAEEWVAQTSSRSDEDIFKMCSHLNLSNCFFECKKYKEAIKIKESLISVQTRVFGGDDVHTLVTKASMARILFEEGSFQRAHALLSEVYEIQKRTLGDNSKYTLSSENELKLRVALMFFEQGEYESAARAQERVVEITSTLTGKRDIRTARSKVLQALCYFRMHMYEQAVDVQGEVVSCHEEVMGATHSETLHNRLILKKFKERDPELHACAVSPLEGLL